MTAFPPKPMKRKRLKRRLKLQRRWIHCGISTAQAALGKARLDLARTTLYAPGLGGITNLNIDVGQYAKTGDPAEILLDVVPGKIFKGEVADT
ncbi:MAG: hypothetical protein IZT60_02415 [Gammaproteobacteria bacterium]|nr:hypothetical protein [Gammaproteobacteria bacterium]